MLIGLLAKAGHGKSTVAKYLVHRTGARILSLAGPLKRAAQKVMKFSDAQLYGSQAQKEAVDPRYGFSARDFLRTLGTEGLRDEFWPEIHLEALLRQVVRARLEGFMGPLVVDDVRFRNEVDFITSRIPDSAIIKIVCTDAPVSSTAHASETEIDLISPESITATIVSSRAQGLNHLYGEFARALEYVAYSERLRA